MENISSKDESTREGYRYVIANFENFWLEKFGNANYVSELKEMDNEGIFDILQSWINWNSKLSPSSTRSYFGKLKKFLYHVGIKLDKQDIDEELSFRHKIQEEKYGLTLDDIQTITDDMMYRHRTLFICQLSSLMRIGEIVQLRKKNLISDKQNIVVKIPSHIAKFKKARTTYFSKEASKLLRPLLREKNDNDLVFGTNENKYSSKSNIQQVLRHALARTGRDMKKGEKEKYNLINTHSFRAYGITKLSRHDPNFAKKIAGQRGYLDEYDRINDDEKFALYQKFEIDLIIDNSEKQKAEITRLESEKSELKKLEETKKKQQEHFIEMTTQQKDFISSMERKLAEMGKEIKELKKTNL